MDVERGNISFCYAKEVLVKANLFSFLENRPLKRVDHEWNGYMAVAPSRRVFQHPFCQGEVVLEP